VAPLIDNTKEEKGQFSQAVKAAWSGSKRGRVKRLVVVTVTYGLGKIAKSVILK
jgi:hypothetical protein